MHIEFLLDDGTGRAVLRAERGPGDRDLPVDSLIFDTAPATFDSDRVAAAGVMLFGEYAGEELSFGKKVSPELGDQITEVTGCTITSKTSGRVIEALGTKTSPGEILQTTTLHVSLATGFGDRTPPVDRTRLGLVPGERFHGALHGIKESLIASNAWMLASCFTPTPVLIASALLYSHDLLAKDVVAELDGGTRGRPSSVVETLCGAVGIGVS